MSTLVTPELEAQAIAWRRHLHAHPELSFAEHETSAFLFELLGGLDGLELDRPTETSLVATMRTGRPSALTSYWPLPPGIASASWPSAVSSATRLAARSS